MPRFLAVPGFQWERFRISGSVREQESGRPLPGLLVRAFDKDVFSDDYLGEAETDAAGHFQIQFTDAQFKDFLESRPDLYLCVLGPDGAALHDTSHAVRENADREEVFEIEISREALPPGA